MEAYQKILAGNNLDQIQALIKSMPISELSLDDADQLFLDLISAVTSSQVAGLMVEKWDYSFESSTPYHIYLCRLFGMEVDKLKLVMAGVNASPQETLMTLIESDDDFLSQAAIGKALEVFQPSAEIVKGLIEHAQAWSNDSAQMALEEYYQKYSPEIEQPPWITELSSSIPTQEELIAVPTQEELIAVPTQEELIAMLPPPYQVEPFTVPPIPDIVEMFSLGLEAQGFSVDLIDESRDKLTQELEQLSREELIGFYRTVAYELQQRDKSDSDLIFSVLGPTNPMVEEDYLDQESPCARYGGCRLLTCTHFVSDFDQELWGLSAEEPLDQLEWFTGVCQTCQKRIPQKFWAVRRPVVMGGWVGTFCSFECARNDPALTQAEGARLISYFENQIRSKGIYNRVWS